MRAILIQQKCAKTLNGKVVLLATMSQANKTEMVNKARSVIKLSLRDKVLREVTKETIVTTMRARLVFM